MQGWIFLTLVAIGSLFSLTALRQLFLDPLDNPVSNWIWLALQVAPLLALLPGVLKANQNTYFFTICVAMLYFVHGVMVAWTPELRWFGFAEIGFALALTAVATYVLRRLRGEAQ